MWVWLLNIIYDQLGNDFVWYMYSSPPLIEPYFITRISNINLLVNFIVHVCVFLYIIKINEAGSIDWLNTLHLEARYKLECSWLLFTLHQNIISLNIVLFTYQQILQRSFQKDSFRMLSKLHKTVTTFIRVWKRCITWR